MSLAKPERPLKAAVAALAAAAFLYAVFTLLFMVVWRYGIGITGVLTSLFLALEAVLMIYAVWNIIRHAKSSEREKFSCRTLFLFLPAVLIYAGLCLYTGYLANTAEVNREKLNNNCYKQLDETKLCESLLSGEDPEDEKFTKSDAAKLLDGKIPHFKGMYTGDLTSSFGTGGKVYLRLGKQALAEMKSAASRRDSAAYKNAAERFAKVLVRAAGVVNDPESTAVILAGEFVKRLESDLSMSFPDDQTMLDIASLLFECRERFESSVMNYTLYVLQGTLSRFDTLKASPGKIADILDPATGKPVFSDVENFAGVLFPAARRYRLIYDYTTCINFLNNQRAAASSAFASLSSRLAQMDKDCARCRELNVPLTLALAIDLKPLVTRTALAATGIENALLAVKVENYRRKNKSMPDTLDDVKGSLLQDIPKCHADGSEWRVESGVVGVPGAASALNIPGMPVNMLKHPGFRVYSGVFSFSILNR